MCKNNITVGIVGISDVIFFITYALVQNLKLVLKWTVKGDQNYPVVEKCYKNLNM